MFFCVKNNLTLSFVCERNFHINDIYYSIYPLCKTKDVCGIFSGNIGMGFPLDLNAFLQIYFHLIFFECISNRYIEVRNCSFSDLQTIG